MWRMAGHARPGGPRNRRVYILAGKVFPVMTVETKIRHLRNKQLRGVCAMGRMAARALAAADRCMHHFLADQIILGMTFKTEFRGLFKKKFLAGRRMRLMT
jgi:hypothetical protein